ncbi:hypothetical protein L327_03630 [Yersinia pestis S3]|nr:hypothetical protein L327_03630 [Yersinia pestis S3]
MQKLFGLLVIMGCVIGGYLNVWRFAIVILATR